MAHQGESSRTEVAPAHSDRSAVNNTRHFADGYRIGYGTGYAVGYAAGVTDEGDAWSAIFTGCAETWRRPDYAELQARREIDWQPCQQRCQACSRCIASLAYWARGGRPYLGVQAEADLVAVAS
jgi:hypothetical protein